MALGIRKLIVLALVGALFLLANAWLVVGWIQEKGLVDLAKDIRKEYLTGTAIAIAVLLVLLVGPRGESSRFIRRCPVCDRLGRGKYCSECGSRV